MYSDDLCRELTSLSLIDTKVAFEGVQRHIPRWRLRELDRIVRFFPYGYTTTPEDTT